MMKDEGTLSLLMKFSRDLFLKKQIRETVCTGASNEDTPLELMINIDSSFSVLLQRYLQVKIRESQTRWVGLKSVDGVSEGAEFLGVSV
jgi:hypothetical protein